MRTKSPVSYLLIGFTLALGLSFSFNDSVEEEGRENTEMSSYDSLLAAQYGADKYGMKRYVIAFLKSGPNRNQDSAEAALLQAGHMANIQRLADEGKLVVAGPFMGKGDLRGIFIFNVTDTTEARILTESDPAIQAGRLIMELKPWYGSAALMAVNELHGKLAKENP